VKRERAKQSECGEEEELLHTDSYTAKRFV